MVMQRAVELRKMKTCWTGSVISPSEGVAVVADTGVVVVVVVDRWR
jgi:hypothetical protein